jgi:hypothetical protein
MSEAEHTEPTVQYSHILLHYKNYYGNDITIVYNPVFDGPLENYKDRDDVTIEYVSWKQE